MAKETETKMQKKIKSEKEREERREEEKKVQLMQQHLVVNRIDGMRE